jgi:phosphopantetheinyl transferase (holo-ACP synthase)
MERSVLLRTIIAELLNTPAENVHADLPLTAPRLQGSIGRAVLDAAIRRRVGVTCPAVYSAATFGELEAGILGGGSTNGKHEDQATHVTQKAAPTFAAGVPGGVECGIDIEMIENLPFVQDCWTDSFYGETFSYGEIAYCLMQADPRMHFTARWCAKEALKKCDNSFLQEKMANLELAQDASGRMILRHFVGGVTRELPFSVSVSHTPVAAVAMVARLHVPQPALPASAGVVEKASAPRPSILPHLGMLIALVAALLAAWALLRTF